MDYSIGDRVEVLWEQILYTTEVRAVYNSGKVDVVYDIDAAVGYLLSMKRGGYCSKKEACAHPNCSTPLVAGKGVCVKHGAHGICTAWGCKTNARTGKKGLCLKHSKDKATCSTSGCSNVVVARGLCKTHGARGFCSTAGCNTGAIKDGLCMVRMGGARLKDAPPLHDKDSSIASHTAAGRRRSRAGNPWPTEPPATPPPPTYTDRFVLLPDASACESVGLTYVTTEEECELAASGVHLALADAGAYGVPGDASYAGISPAARLLLQD
eukprot:gene13732-biopygen8299